MPQQKPPPDRFTKSIVLAGGIQEDAPELLRQLPALAYVENGRFRKINEIEKTLPEEEFETITGSFFVEGADDTLHVGYPYGIVELDEASDIVASEYVPFTLEEKIASTTATAGACNFSWGRSAKPGEDPFYVIAYETRQGHPSTLIGSSVHVEAYDDSGRLLRRKSFGLSTCTPIVSKNNLGTILVHYAISNGQLYCYDYENDTSTGLAGIDVKTNNAVVEGLLSVASILPAKEYNALRYGFMPSGQNAWFQVHYQGLLLGDGVLLYQDAASGDIYGVKIGDTGQPTATEVFLGNGSATVCLLPLDVKVVGVGANAKIWYLVYVRTVTTLGTILKAVRTDNDLNVEGDVDIINETETITIINARFEEGVTDPATGMKVAFTTHFYNENEIDIIDSIDISGTKLHYGDISNTFVYSEWGSVFDHVLTSNPIFDADEGGVVYFTCEQIITTEPYAPTKDFGRVSIPISILKPVTSYLIRAKNSAVSSIIFDPICAFDVNSSKHMGVVMQEQPARTGQLRYVSGDLVYLNRKLLQGEDGSVYMAPPVAGNLFKRISTSGEFIGVLHRVTLDSPLVRATTFGKGAIVNSGLPVLYTAGEVQEIGVLEQPEIVSFYQEGDLNELNADNCWCYVVPIDEETEKWITVQIVVGFVDALGFVHRSAPSFPMFVKGVRPDETNNITRVLRFTQPITMAATEFFVEVFEAAFGEVPQLASVQSFDPKDSTDRVTVEYDGLIKYVNKKEAYPVRASEFVYTTGGTLPADPWSSFDLMVSTSRRVFVASGSTVYFTKLIEENTAPEMNAVLNIPFGLNKTITAMGKIDDKVIVFERDAIHAIYGDGPDNIGQGDFIVDRIQTTVGCASNKSLVEIPEGLIFYSDISGSFHIIDRNFDITDVGGPVMDLISDITITASTLFPKEGEIRWYVTSPAIEEFGPDPDTGTNIPPRPPRPRFQNVLPSGAVLVFNYSYSKWTVLSGQPADDVTIFKDEIYRLYDGDIFRTCEVWGNAKLLKYRTPWVPVQDLQNQGRIDKVALLGQYLSSWQDNGNGIEAGDIQITSRYNYEEFGNSHTYRWRANSDLSNLEGNRLQLTFKPGQPKAQAIQLLVEEIPTEKLTELEPDYTVGRGFVMSGLDLLCKPKRGFGDKSLGQKRSK